MVITALPKNLWCCKANLICIFLFSRTCSQQKRNVSSSLGTVLSDGCKRPADEVTRVGYSTGTIHDISACLICFGKVVFRGRGGLTVDGLFGDLGAVRAVAPTVVVIDIGTNDLSNKNCVPEDLADRTVAFARELLTIPSVAQVVVCEIVPRVPVRFSRYEVRPDFEHVRQIVNDKIYASIKIWKHYLLASS